MSLAADAPPTLAYARDASEVEVVIEVPKGSFLKRGTSGHLDFVSPMPCPFNYGSVPEYMGQDGDLLDALVLGPRLPLWTRTRVIARGAVILTDRGLRDDKLVCSARPLDSKDRRIVLNFFRLYAKCKGLLNMWRRHEGRNACEGWCEVDEAIARAEPQDRSWTRPRITR